MSVQTYEEWKKHDPSTYGLEFFTSDRMLQNQERSRIAIDKCGELAGKAIAKKIYEEGFAPLKELQINILRNELSGGGWLTYIYDFNDRPPSNLPEQYCHKAWLSWQEEYTRRLNWENKSLWSYIKHWWGRKLKHD